jgi:ribosomal-protein-alanine N-acetyltransferase
VQIRAYVPSDFKALYQLDQSCFPRGIAYSKSMLRYFLDLPSAQCLVALEGEEYAGFILSEATTWLAHIITLDVTEAYRRHGVGTMLLRGMEKSMAARGLGAILLETAVNNEAGVAFWQRHGYEAETVLKRYYLSRIDAYEMRKLL